MGMVGRDAARSKAKRRKDCCCITVTPKAMPLSFCLKVDANIPGEWKPKRDWKDEKMRMDA
jgi:hypothetical protein